MTTAPNHAEAPTRHRWIRPKRRLSGRAWRWLAVMTAATLAILAGKFFGPLVGWEWLRETFTLGHLDEATRARLGHLFIVPIGALVVILARLTLNLRTLGPFRAILLAMAFESAGFGLGLAFAIVVTAAVMLLRPATRSMGLPYYGRVLTIVSVVSGIVVLVLLVASATGAVDLAPIASFPIVVLALTGDTSSRILAREGARTLATRFAITLLAAALIAAIVGQDAVRETLIAYPELIALQIVTIVLVSELFDIRLFGGVREAPLKPRKRSGAAAIPVQAMPIADLLAGPLRVAVVRNRSKRGILGRSSGRRIPAAYSRKAIQRILDALREAGYQARAFEGDATLLTSLAGFLPVDPATQRVHGVVLNLAPGIQGASGAAHVPAMLELAGVPYTGADPRGHALCGDIAAMRQALVGAGVATPAHVILRERGGAIGGLEFPLSVRPRDTSATRAPRLVLNRAELEEAVGAVLERSRCDAIVESHVEGRSLTVPILGDAPLRTLPIVESVRSRADDDSVSTKLEKRCPARLDPALERRVRAAAIAAAEACGVRDIGRVDLRIDRTGEPFVLQVHALPSLGWAGATVKSARRGGYRFPALIGEMIRAAAKRAGLDRQDASPAPASESAGRA